MLVMLVLCEEECGEHRVYERVLSLSGQDVGGKVRLAYMYVDMCSYLRGG